MGSDNSHNDPKDQNDLKNTIHLMIGLIKPTNYLLDRQIRRLEQDFLNAGGLRERMTHARLAQRQNNRNKHPND